MKEVSSFGVCYPKGFIAGAVSAGLKKNGYDLGAVFSEVDCVCAGVFTKNKVQAAPVVYCKAALNGSVTRGVVVNSGNANACTGEDGLADVGIEAKTFGKAMNVPASQIMILSTGVIGYRLPMDKVLSGIEAVSKELSVENGLKLAQAMMTTDTKPKQAGIDFAIGNKSVKIGSVAKGSGMIHPNMGTMLSVITTDVNIEKSLLQKALCDATELSFNMVTVDGDTSTNDTVLLLANGCAGNELITDETSEEYKIFYDNLVAVCVDLAKQIAADGEGAGKLVTVNVSGAKSKEDAKLIAKSVCGSNLVKTAIFGEDANWGRILAAAGYSGAEFDPNRVCISFGSDAGKIVMAVKGRGVNFDEAEAKKVLSESEIEISVELMNGEDSATAWCCDLSYDYIKINADYRS